MECERVQLSLDLNEGAEPNLILYQDSKNQDSAEMLEIIQVGKSRNQVGRLRLSAEVRLNNLQRIYQSSALLGPSGNRVRGAGFDFNQKNFFQTAQGIPGFLAWKNQRNQNNQSRKVVPDGFARPVRSADDAQREVDAVARGARRRADAIAA